MLIAALTLEGIGPRLRFDGSMTADRFVGYVLGPTLRPGQIVVMDNLSAHHAQAARMAIEACGARVRFLPPYLSDFNPIEEVFSKLKQALRRAKARSDDDLRAAAWAAFAAITSIDASGWFAHCGYTQQTQPS